MKSKARLPFQNHRRTIVTTRKNEGPGDGHGTGEIYIPIAVPGLCEDIVTLGRRRRRIMRRQTLIDRPAEQDFKAELIDLFGPDHGMSPEKLYGMAAVLRKYTLKTIPDCADEARDLGSVWSEEAHARFKRRFAEASDRELTDVELEVVARLAVDVLVDRRSLDVFGKQRKAVEKKMVKAAGRLPVYGWWAGHRGCNGQGLANIIAETGDLSNYDSPCKVWKRMGMAPYKGKAPSTWRKNGANGELKR